MSATMGEIFLDFEPLGRDNLLLLGIKSARCLPPSAPSVGPFLNAFGLISVP